MSLYGVKLRALSTAVCACRDASLQEALGMSGLHTWSLRYSRHHPLTATAAAAIISDQQKQHLQQLPWNKVVPVPAASGTAVCATARDSSKSRRDQAKATPAPTRGGSSAGKSAAAMTREGTGASSSSRSSADEGKLNTALWWEASENVCDLCGIGCDGDQMQLCEVCGAAQYCSSSCQRAALAAGRHPWAACRELATVQAGRWKSAS